VSLEGKVALVVGGEPGLAAAVCQSLAGAGCAVVAAGAKADTDAAESPATTEVDVTDAASTQSMARRVIDQFGRIDVLVNGGSYQVSAHRTPWSQIEPAEWDRCFSAIVRATWLSCRAVAPYMKQQRSGRIITIGSTAPWSGAPGFLHYATATSALIGLTRSLARELGSFDVSVNMVCPDPPADVAPALRQHGEPQVFDARWPALPGPVGLAGVVGSLMFFASADSDFITGQSYLVNGGTWFQ
jgi:3-oxoacyl-[acyl-carrier protein] reductase